MKNLKKIFAIAMSVATVAMSTSAFADAITATYDAENTAVLIEKEDATAIVGETEGQMTVVVVPEGFGDSTTSSDDIYYINQDDADAFAGIIENMGVKAALDGQKNWQVRIGGTNVTEVIVLNVAFEKDEPVVTVVYGDADKNGTVAAFDASRILQYLAKWDVEIDLAAADADGNGAVAAFDASRILQYLAKWDVTLGPVTAE